MAQQSKAENNADMRQSAIDLANSAAKYCEQEQRRHPHYATLPGKLTSVYGKSWERSLAAMAR